MILHKTPSFRLDGKRALVSGATSGIGLAAAMGLAEHGAEVTLMARTENKLAEAARLIESHYGTTSYIVADIAKVTQVKEALGPLPAFDILVNSAGTARHSKALETEEADYDTVMDVNLKGAFFLTQTIAQRMVENNIRGSIINISSQMGHVGGQERAVYCASKHAVEGMTKAMAVEWGPNNIRINTICPTFIQTPLVKATLSDPEKFNWIKEKIKLGRLGEVEDIMGAVVFMASDAASLITGTALLIDGGWTAD